MRISTVFLKVAIMLITIAALAFLFKFPQTEGRAANLDLISIYKDPFIIYIYIASIPFFVGLFQAFKLLNFIDARNAISQGAANTLKNIKFASISLISSLVIAVVYIRFFSQGDDPAGPTALGIFAIFTIVIITASSAFFESRLRNSLNTKIRNGVSI